MNQIVTIEKIDIKDIQHLRDIGIQTFYETFVETNTKEDMQAYLDDNFSIEKLTAELSIKDSHFYFAKQNNQVMAYLKINFKKAQTESFSESSMEIERIYVCKQFIRQKIGQILCDKAIQLANKEKVKIIWLGVWEHNTRAIKFYEKNGFQAFDKHVFMLGLDKQTDILMKLEL
jgi:ribosomal protein S18 acetylase RimI-like enzyme